MKLYNTLTRKLEEFKPLKDKKVGMYTCGPTVYDYDHIGHAWNYTTADFLRRTLEYNGYKVKHVMNITDVGHLTSDADTGEDKLERASANMLYIKCKYCHKETPTFIAATLKAFETGNFSSNAVDCKNCGKQNVFSKADMFFETETVKRVSIWEIADFFTKIYLANRQKLNLEEPKVICKATDHIKEMLDMVQILLDKGYAYQTSDGIYFNTLKFPKYGQLSGNTLESLKEGARVEVNPEKKNPTDFALWKFSAPGEKRQMEWEAFGLMGFPGWHIECSAMSMKYLGESFELHSGGEDNIFPHHECEIAQSESVTGKPFVRYWLHTRFLMVDGQKMSKSLNNFYTIADLETKGFSALDLRYLFLTAHYRSQLNFTWQSLDAAKTARERLNNFILGIKKKGKVNKSYKEMFLEKINEDLDMPQALSLVWQIIKDKNVSDEDKKATLFDWDKVLGLDLAKLKKEKVTIPKEVQDLVKEREAARKNKNWLRSDELRSKIGGLGYWVEDTDRGTVVKKK